MNSIVDNCFLIRRHQRPILQTDQNDVFAFVRVELVRPPLARKEYYSFSLIENPSQYLEGGSVHINTIRRDERLGPTEIYRPSRRSFATRFFKVELYYDGYEYRSADESLKIPVLKITHAVKILPSGFKAIGEQPAADKYKVVLQFHSSLENRNRIPNARTALSTSSAPSTLPQHLVNMILEAAIDKTTSCPISFDPLTKISARLTPCGHLVSHPAVERWLSSAHSCPVCRQELEVSALMKWVA